MNNRDHRKILVIDGYVAFNGGVNLADEYINEYEKHGHWKDSAVMLKGEAVWSFTVMFLTMWSFLDNFEPGGRLKFKMLKHKDLQLPDCTEYMPRAEDTEPYKADGYTIPYTDSPLDDEPVGENAYLNIINDAREYVYITTPYLIIDNEMSTALILAAKSGIDVRIITPHIADKWYVHAVTRAHYKKLVKYGVKIYEYTPGFIHAKNFVSDDNVAVVGTINLDFRSLYLHFECATEMYKTDAVLKVKEDYLKTLEECQEITYSDCLNVNIFVRIGRMILRLFAPMM
jgi:cardiolipin synthase